MGCKPPALRHQDQRLFIHQSDVQLLVLVKKTLKKTKADFKRENLKSASMELEENR